MSQDHIFFDQSSLKATDGIFRQHIEDQAKAKTLQDAQQKLFGPNNRTAVRPKSAEEVGIRRQDARVAVRKGYFDDGGPCIEVAVYSIMSPGSFKRVRLDKYSPTAAIQTAAGACAEGCCESFADPFDPAQAAHDSVEGLRRLREG